MAYTYSLDNCSFTASFSGVVTRNELAECDNFHDSKVGEIKVSLWDFTSVDDFALTLEDIEQLVKQDSAIEKNNRKLTVILVSKPMHKTFLHAYRKKASILEWDIQVLFDIEEAKSLQSKILSIQSQQ